MLVRSGPDKLLISLPRPGSIGSAGCSVLFAVELKFPHYGLRGFDAAMTRTRSLECRGKNRAVAEARPGRDDVSLRGSEWLAKATLRERPRPARPSSGTALRSTTCGAVSRQACGQPPWSPSWSRYAVPGSGPTPADRSAWPTPAQDDALACRASTQITGRPFAVSP